MAWPNIKTPNIIDVSHVRELYKSDADTGAVMSRPRFTRAKKKFSLGWSGTGAMSLADLNSLLTAFDTDLGSSFAWTNADTGQAYTVVYAEGKIKYKSVQVGSGFYTVSLLLEEN